MKKFTILISLMIISSSILFAQSNADVDINAKTNPHATTFTDDLFDEQFQFVCEGGNGEAGIETNGNYIYTSKWNGDKFFCYEIDGTFLGEFTVPGVYGVRDMTYDGTYFYGSCSGTNLYQMDFNGPSGVILSTLTAAVATRAIAYNPEYDAFYGNNWSDPITLYDRSGNILNQFDCGEYSSYYGFAWLDCGGSSWLYGFAQSGGSSQAVIVQMDSETGAETGVTFDAIEYSTTGTSVAGGLAEYFGLIPGMGSLIGIIQNETVFGVESCIICPLFNDLKLIKIIEPNTSEWLDLENIIIKIINLGTNTQNNFDVKYRVDSSEWIIETIPGPLVHYESIVYTFLQSYDFSEERTYFIEACTYIPDDEYPDNDCMDKEIEHTQCSYMDGTTQTEDEYIANVLMGMIDNSSGWQGGTADYTDLFTIIEVGIPQEIVVTNGNAWADDYVFVWVDWNDDCFFEQGTSNEQFQLENIYGTGAVFKGDIIAPADVIEGSHRMRVRMVYQISSPCPTCDYTYGEVEDYTVVVTEFVPPEIAWDPTSFTQFVEYGGIAQDFLTIENIGEGPLLWNIEVNTPWLILDTLGSIVAPNDSIEVTLNFNPGYLPAGSYYAGLILTSNDTINSEVIIPVEMQIEPPESHFIFEGGDPSSSLWEIYIGNAKLEDNDLVTHDEIAIFDGDFMVGVFTLTQVCSPENQMENNLTAFSELNTQSGYQAGNAFTFRCWDASEQLEVDFCYIELLNPYGDAYIGNVFPSEDDEYSIAALDFLSLASQTIDLSLGFQFISSSIDPDKPDMLIVLDEILNDNLYFIRNSYGQTLRKIGPNWVNGIGDWIIEEGYLVKMNASDSLTIYGAQVVPISLIPVSTGFQFVSYFPKTPMDALYAFKTIIGDNLDFIRNSTGQMLRKIGTVWVNGIGECNPDEGYLVKMFADDIIIYPFPCGNPFADPRDDQIYNTVQIGDQCWMAENMNIGEMKIGTEEMANNGIIEKYCYDNNIANCNTYGGLYQWDEMMQYTIIPGVQGICPIGWSIPTDDEWKILEGTVDSLYPVGDPIWNNTEWRGFDAGLKLKSTSGWYPNFYRSDTCGFRALPGGYRNCSGYFYSIEGYGIFWSSTESISIEAWYRGLKFNMDKVSRYDATKEFGRSVRCLKNNSNYSNFSKKIKNGDNNILDQKNLNIEADHFLFEGGNPADPVFTIYIDGLEIGDEISAYDGDILVGAMKINSKNKYDNELPIFSTLNRGKGYTSGNPIILKVWNKNENQEYNLTDFTFSNPYGDAWTENVFPSEDGEYSLLNFSTSGISDENMRNDISIYPNPTTGIITIGNLNLLGFQNLTGLNVEITDITGKIVFNSDISDNSSSIEIDLSQLEKGVYFLNLNGKDFNQVNKIVIQ